MRVLAVDTATVLGSVCLVEDGVVRSEAHARLRGGPSGGLLALVEAALAMAGARLDDVDLLAAGLGPGSFTGVRVGLATMKGLRLATERPLVGVGTLEALAHTAACPERAVLAVVDAQRGELFVQPFAPVVDASGLRAPLDEPRCLAPQEAAERLRALDALREGGLVGIGALPDERWAPLRAALPGLRLAEPNACASAARWVALLALAGRGARDEGDLEPRYVRPSDAKLPSVALRAIEA